MDWRSKKTNKYAILQFLVLQSYYYQKQKIKSLGKSHKRHISYIKSLLPCATFTLIQKGRDFGRELLVTPYLLRLIESIASLDFKDCNKKKNGTRT